MALLKTTIGRHPADRKKMAVNVQNGREAVTHYKVIDNLNNKYTYVECQLETGRTHQIRVHMASIGNPVLGDKVYGPSKCPFNLQGADTSCQGTLGFITLLLHISIWNLKHRFQNISRSCWEFLHKSNTA